MITFIVGTDTGVGKTHYGKKLILEGKKLIKPIETGKNSFKDLSESDSYIYSRMQDLSIEEVNLYFFTEALSPHIASEIDGVHIDIDRLTDFIRSKENPYVELAGGLMVPIKRNYNQLDLIKAFREDERRVDLVVGNKLGCINHALLSLEILNINNIEINRIFINDYGIDNNRMIKDNEKIINDYFEKNLKRCL